MVITGSSDKMESTTEQQTIDLVIAFIGLPSAGKSTMVNSLVGKRVLQTGVCRTTTDVFYVGPSNTVNFSTDRYVNEHPISDDKIKYSIIDLPGVCDGQDDKHDYDEKTSTWITSANIICWISDIQTAFLTTHEKNEFDKYKQQLDKKTLETGTLYQMCIVLTKYDFDDDECEEKKKTVDKIGNEIEDDDEDTTIHDCYKRVAELFKTYTDIRIIKFNAFGRIQHCKKMSPQLRKLVKKDHFNVNTSFNIKWTLDDYVRKEQESFVKCAFDKMLKIYDLLETKSSNYETLIEKLLETLSTIKQKLNNNNICLIRKFLFDLPTNSTFSFTSHRMVKSDKKFKSDIFTEMQNTVWINVFDDIDYDNWMSELKEANQLLRIYLAWHDNKKFWKNYYTFGDRCDFHVYISDRKSKSFVTTVAKGYCSLNIYSSLDWFGISTYACSDNYIKHVSLTSSSHVYKPRKCREMDEECVTTINVCKIKWLESIASLRNDIYGKSADGWSDPQMLVMSLRQRTITSLFQQIK